MVHRNLSKIIAASKMVVFMILLFHGLQPSTDVTKNSILGVLGVFDPPMGFYNVVLKFVQVLKLCNFAVLLYKLLRWQHVYHYISYVIIESISKLELHCNSSTEAFMCITSHFSLRHHAVMLLLFLDFSRVLGVSCSSKQTSFTSKLTSW